MHRFTKKALSIFCSFLILAGVIYFHPLQAQADPSESVTNRIYGNTQYDTAVEISKNGWDSARAAVLATGNNFPDALAGSVLAQKVGGPLLLTESDHLTAAVASELKRLGTQEVYLLGGTVALSSNIEQSLKDLGIIPRRIAGWDQYGTAAAIAGIVSQNSEQAFLVNGEHFADALSISSYAAAQGIPILLTDSDSLPSDTAKALAQLGVREVTLVGGTAVIKDSVVAQLGKLAQPVKVTARYAGIDQYETNTTVLNHFSFDTSKVYVATGLNFPDALAGAALAAKSKAPILLLPQSQLGTSTTTYLNQRRASGAAFTIFGGWAVISYKLESIIRTGAVQARISLQYTQGSLQGMLNQVQSIPTPATDYADILAPSWLYLDDTADGNVTGGWDSSSGDYAKFTAAAHSRDLKVLPVIQSSWASSKTADTVLASPTARAKLEDQLLQRLQSTNSDGIVIDFELMSNSTGPNLTQFMKELYAKLHTSNKLVIEAVMARTGTETWNTEFNYHDLAQYVDYLHIMTYDYSKATPGPIAPLSWINKVLTFTRSQGVDMHKVLLGIPYYGYDWSTTDTGSNPTYTHRSGEMSNLLALANGSVQRDSSQIPYFTYSDSAGTHTVYYDDAQSWNAKLALLNQYNLGGVGAWSLYWVQNTATKNAVFPLLKQYLR